MAENENPEKLEVLPVETVEEPGDHTPYTEVPMSKEAKLFGAVQGTDKSSLSPGAKLWLILVIVAITVGVLFACWLLFRNFIDL